MADSERLHIILNALPGAGKTTMVRKLLEELMEEDEEEKEQKDKKDTKDSEKADGSKKEAAKEKKEDGLVPDMSAGAGCRPQSLVI